MDHQRKRSRAPRARAQMCGLVASAVTLLLALTMRASAQARYHDGYAAHANCRVWQAHVDNPFDHTHYYTQPALAWDVESALASGLATLALAQFTPLSPMAAALIPSVGLGLGPHLVGYAEHRYPITLHWAFTLSDRSFPVAFFAPASRRRAALQAWSATTVALLCWDR